MNYKTSAEICKQLKISRPTLKRWKDEGKIKTQVLSSRKILYDIDSIIKPDVDDRVDVIYARVSTTSQKEDLTRQTQMLTNFMVNNGVIPSQIFEEIASGMNEDRPHLNQLVQLVVEGKVRRVYISYKDRLTRFGFDYFRHIFGLFGTEIVVVNGTKEEDFQTELTQDFVSIIHHFSMKMYSHRRKELREMAKKLQEA